MSNQFSVLLSNAFAAEQAGVAVDWRATAMRVHDAALNEINEINKINDHTKKTEAPVNELTEAPAPFADD